MNMFAVFRTGACALVTSTMAYTGIHRQYGLSQPDWDLVTQAEPWNVEQRAKAKAIIAECVMISLTIAGLPAQQLPAQYVAAVIAHIVSPANMLVASTRAPEAFDAMAASGMQGDHEIKPVPIEQMQSLVMAYAGGAAGEPLGHALPKETEIKSMDTKS